MQLKLAITLLSLALKASALDFYVSTAGRDTNAGTAAAPFATIEKARDAIKAKRLATGLPKEGFTVWIAGGQYQVKSTINFAAQDSGTETSRITYTAMPGQQVFLTGARKVTPTAFKPLSASVAGWTTVPVDLRSKILYADLKALGIVNYGSLKARGFYQSTTAPMELIVNGDPMTLARWPNKADPMVRTKDALSNTQFTFTDSRIEKWAGTSDVWIHGYLGNTWADYHAKVASINGTNKTVSLTAAPQQFGLTANRLFYAYNLLSELDQPGEYYIDRTAGYLYYYPSTDLANATVQLTESESFLMNFNGASCLTFKDIVLEASRATLVNMYSGTNNRFINCVFRNAGQNGAMLDGTNNGLDHCEVVDCGEIGVQLKGGVRATLTPGKNFVTNSWIHRVARTVWTAPGVRIPGGCGEILSHNVIEEMPDSALRFYGNNHLIEFNELRRVCQLSSDVGVIYTGKDWGLRGNVVRNNFIHSIKANQEGNGVYGIYIDDCGSGVEISSNIIYDVATIGITVRGGRDNIIKNNIIAKCGIAHSNSDSGRSYINNIPGDPYNLLEKLSAENIKRLSDPWKSAFPACAAIPSTWAALKDTLWLNPQGCVFDDNVGWQNQQWLFELNNTNTGVFSVYASMANNRSTLSALFTDEAVNNRRLRSSVISAPTANFAPVSFAAIGPMQDQVATTPPFPPAANLSASHVTESSIDLNWTTSGGLAGRSIAGFDLERRNLPDGSWSVIRSYNGDSSFDTVNALAPSTQYAFRMRSYNSTGSIYSSEMVAETNAVLVTANAPARIEAESNYTVAKDVGTISSVSIVSSSLNSGASVRTYDIGDTIVIPVNIPTAGQYSISLRTICGNRVNSSAFWPSGYRVFLGTEGLSFNGDISTISVLDNYMGQAYWGTMTSNIVNLSAGTQSLTISSAFAYGAVDYVEINKLTPKVPSTYNEWMSLHFTADQILDSSIAGSNVSAVGDSYANFVKYALGIDPWANTGGSLSANVATSFASTATTVAAPSFFTVSTKNNRLQLDYSRPAGRIDAQYYVEVSSDQKSWTALEQTLKASINGTEYLAAIDNSSNFNLFIRIRVQVGADSYAFATQTSPDLIDPSLITGLNVGGTVRVEAETGYQVLFDAAVLGKVGIADTLLDTGKSLKMYDVGNKVRYYINVPASGYYVLSAREKSGDMYTQASHWPNGYLFDLNGAPVTLSGDLGTFSELDTSYGYIVWGVVTSSAVYLEAGLNYLDITSARSWGFVDYVDLTPIASATAASASSMITTSLAAVPTPTVTATSTSATLSKSVLTLSESINVAPKAILASVDVSTFGIQEPLVSFKISGTSSTSLRTNYILPVAGDVVAAAPSLVRTDLGVPTTVSGGNVKPTITGIEVLNYVAPGTYAVSLPSKQLTNGSIFVGASLASSVPASTAIGNLRATFFGDSEKAPVVLGLLVTGAQGATVAANLDIQLQKAAMSSAAAATSRLTYRIFLNGNPVESAPTVATGSSSRPLVLSPGRYVIEILPALQDDEIAICSVTTVP